MIKSTVSRAHHPQSHLIRESLMAGAVALLLLPPFAYAQQGNGRPASQNPDGSISVTPHIGLYMPLGSLVADNTVRLRPVGSIALGSRVAWPFLDGFAMEAALSWSPNLIAQSDWKETVDLEGGVWFGSARVRARLGSTSAQSETSASITTGVGVVHRYGDAWNGMRGTTDAALVVGGGLRYLEIESGIAFTVDIEGFLTRTGYTDAAGHFYGGRLQQDFIFSFGTSINLGRN
jgi:hypothetical protein